MAHEPDIFPRVPERVSLTLSGHTHGGQVDLPFVGRPVVPSVYGERYAYGHVVEEDRHMVDFRRARLLDPAGALRRSAGDRAHRNRRAGGRLRPRCATDCFRQRPLLSRAAMKARGFSKIGRNGAAGRRLRGTFDFAALGDRAAHAVAVPGPPHGRRRPYRRLTRRPPARTGRTRNRSGPSRAHPHSSRNLIPCPLRKNALRQDLGRPPGRRRSRTAPRSSTSTAIWSTR